MPVIAIRPEPGCGATVALAAEIGLDVAGHPLFAVEPVAWDLADAGEYDAILLGSANALRHGGPGLHALTLLPTLCVGESTASVAHEAGFNVVATGSGGLQSVLPAALEQNFHRLLRLSGEAHVPLSPPVGMRIDTVTCYRVHPDPIDATLAATLARGALVLLHSGEAAAHFSAEVDRLEIARSAIALACLAPRIAERAGTGWAALCTASVAEDRALLALAAQMCQS